MVQVSLHTNVVSPGDSQTLNEISYKGYRREVIKGFTNKDELRFVKVKSGGESPIVVNYVAIGEGDKIISCAPLSPPVRLFKGIVPIFAPNNLQLKAA